MTFKSESFKALAQLGGQPKLSIVGQRCGNNWIGQIGSSTPYANTHQRVLCPYGANAIQLVYPNFMMKDGGQGELPLTPCMFSARPGDPITVSGGSGFAVGDMFTMSISNTTGLAAAIGMVTSVSAGVPTTAMVVDGGLYNTLPSTTPASTSGGGSLSGMTATFTWTAGGFGARIGIEPVWNSLVAVGGGAGAVEMVSRGVLANTSLSVNLLTPLNDFLVTDLLPIDVPVGGAIGIRTCFGYGTPPMNRLLISASLAPGAPSANYEVTNATSTFTDQSISGTMTSSGWGALYQPALILGIPKIQGPTIMALGDSRCSFRSTGLNVVSSSYDPGDIDGNNGWFEKALSLTINKAYYPWSNLAVNTDALYRLFSSATQGGKIRLKLIGKACPTAVYMGLNVNDFSGGTSLIQVQKWEQEIIGELRGLGVKYVFTDTTDPCTTSSDSWATVANQTLTSYSNNIIQRNQALAAKTWASYDFFIDQRPNTESSINSGKWVVNGTANYTTGDGLHASPQIIALKAATAAAAIAANIAL